MYKLIKNKKYSLFSSLLQVFEQLKSVQIKYRLDKHKG